MGNYTYDPIGNLISDAAEEIAEIQWYVNGKVKAILRTSGSTKPNLYFDYAADGQRVRKRVVANAGSGSVTNTWYIRDAQGNTMATYTTTIAGTDTTQYAQEHYLYGSSRLSSHARNVSIATLTNSTDTSRYTRVLGHKQYELSNHLGNVLATITDHKTPVATSGTITHWQPTVRSYTDYYPFGMEMGERSGRAGEYRYSFQAQETDGEVYGPGNAVSYKYRIHDARIGRFLSVDPLYREYPWNSTYAFSENRLIDAVELEGLEAWKINNEWNNEYKNMFQTEFNSRINALEKQGSTYTCDDLALEVVIRFARDHNLPFKWETEYKNYNASSVEYSDFNTFLYDVKSHSGAPDFSCNTNTKLIDYEAIRPGSLVVLTAEGRSRPNHIQMISSLHIDEGVIKGYNAIQGNFRTDGLYGVAARLVGSDSPSSWRYLGVPIQEGYYSKDADYWSNHSTDTRTMDFFEDHYSGDYREFNFDQMNYDESNEK